jgi:hypothetical protein
MRDFGPFLHPEWDQSPTCHDHLTLTVAGINAYNRDLISGSYVVAERKIGLRQALSIEEAAIRIASDQIVETATHIFKDMHLNRKSK